MERSGNDKKEKPYRLEQRAEENSYTNNSRESKGKDFYSFSENLLPPIYSKRAALSKPAEGGRYSRNICKAKPDQKSAETGKSKELEGL